MSPEAIRELARRAIDEVWTAGDPAAVAELYAEDYFGNTTGGDPVVGRAAVMRAVAAFRQALPDLELSVHDQVVEGDRVATRWSGRGTYAGEAVGEPGPRRSVRVGGITIHRVREGRIVEGWTCWEATDFAQLRLVPPLEDD